jgi:hypothetical protein
MGILFLWVDEVPLICLLIAVVEISGQNNALLPLIFHPKIYL